jgi:hypothetical protein
MAEAIETYGDLHILWDEARDVLYISVGTPRPAWTEEEDHGVLVRFDLKTNTVIGVTITEYREHFQKLFDLSFLQDLHLPPQIVSYLEVQRAARR